MKNLKKNAIIFLITFLLIIPIFFGIYVDFLIIIPIGSLAFIILFTGMLFFLILSELLIKFVFKNDYLDNLKKHDMINAFIERDRTILFIVFPMTMLMEELIFRYYCISLLSIWLGSITSIFISSCIFGLYHFHFLNLFANVKLIFLFIGYSFLLGMYLAFIFLNFGLILSLLLHLGVAYLTYFEIYRKRLKKN